MDAIQTIRRYGESRSGVFHRACQWISPALILVITFAIAPTLQAQARIGFVVDIKGDWVLYPKPQDNDTQGQDKKGKVEDGTKLSKWDDVPAGAVIRSRAAHDGDFITIVDKDSLNVLVSSRCEQAASCYKPIYLPDQLNDSGLSAELEAGLKKARDILLGEPPQASMHRVRGAAPRVDEAVVRLTGDEIDLRPVMQRMPRGRYSLAPYGQMTGGRPPAQAAAFDWDPHIEALILVRNQKPGLYEVEEITASENSPPDPNNSVRVLVCSSGDYEDIFNSFEKVRGLTDTWANTASQDSIHAFLRAYLAGLASGSKSVSGQR